MSTKWTSNTQLLADVEALLSDIHEAHYAHGFKFSENGHQLFQGLAAETGGYVTHDDAKNARLRAEHGARRSKMNPADVHGDMFNERITSLAERMRAHKAKKS